MAELEIVARVQRNFGFLFRRFGYRVIAATAFKNDGNWLVVLESASCGRLLVMQDRGEIIVALGPLGPSTNATAVPWFDLPVVVEYLSQGEDRPESPPGDSDEQLASLAGTLDPYMEHICGLFTTTAFDGAKPDLDRIGSRREAEFWGR